MRPCDFYKRNSLVPLDFEGSDDPDVSEEEEYILSCYICGQELITGDFIAVGYLDDDTEVYLHECCLRRNTVTIEYPE